MTASIITKSIVSVWCVSEHCFTMKPHSLNYLTLLRLTIVCQDDMWLH